MEFTLKRRTLTALFLLLILTIPPSWSVSAKHSARSIPEGANVSRPVSIAVTDSEYGTTVNILSHVKVSEYRTEAFDSPPMIVVDILKKVPSFESVTITLKSPNLKNIRLGYHPDKIRVVLGIRGSRIPPFSTESVNNGLSLFLRSKALAVQPQPTKKERKVIHTEKQKPVSSGGGISSLEKLIQIERDDGQKDTALFINSVQAYRKQDWSGAIDNLRLFLTTYPTNRYAERAYFLYAKAFEKRRSNSAHTYFAEVKSNYTEAVRKFPQSIHVAEALLSIADLYFGIGNYYEARGYYNLVFKKAKESLPAMRATIQNAKILARRNNSEKALELLEKVIDKYPNSQENAEAKIEKAKALYEMNHFVKSSKILSKLKEKNPDYRYRYPEIFLYLGYNYYQLGQTGKSRENLLRYYNSSPDGELNHLILTKIGDTYREEGAFREASEFYNLVIALHPEREGAVIGRIRLAELKEDGAIENKKNYISDTDILGREQGSAGEIYEKILSRPIEQDEKRSLEKLTMFKLSLVYHNEKKYDKSIETLESLLKTFPGAILKKESIRALKKTIGAVLDEEMKRGKYTNVIKTYEKRRNLFSLVNDPDLFLKVGRASIRLDLHGTAAGVFKKADALLPNKKKPPDLLFYLAEDLFKKEELKQALVKTDLLLKNYPADTRTPDAYHLKGRILSKEKKLKKAIEMFSSAAEFDLSSCKRAGLLIDKGRALVDSGFSKKAFDAIGEANRLRGDCSNSDTGIGMAIGGIYLRLGYPKDALSIFQQALSIEKNKESIILLKLKVAESYQLLNKRADSLALYDQLAAIDDPFWSNLAKERIEEMNFKKELEEKENESRRQ